MWVGASVKWSGHLPSSPTPSPASHPVSLSQSVSQSGRAAGQSGRLSCRVARNVQPTCPPALPQCCPVGGVSGCLGCLENFSETPGHPVCFGLCSSHHTPSAHPHHTTPHHSTAITTTVQHTLACTHVPCHPCTLARVPGCASARSDMEWSLLRDKASPAVMPWGSPKAAQGTGRFACVLVKSRKAAPPLPSFIYQVHNPTTTSLRLQPRFHFTYPTLVQFLFYNTLASTSPPPTQPIYSQLAVSRTRSAGLVTVTLQHQYLKPTTVTTCLCV